MKITRLPIPGRWYAVTGAGVQWTRAYRTASHPELLAAMATLEAVPHA
jgi:hypothetical protein